MSAIATRASSRLRTALFASAALSSMVIAGTAQAQSASPIDKDGVTLEAQTGRASIDVGAPTSDYLEPQVEKARIAPVDPDPEIVIANPQTPTTARDPVNITGIAQMVTDGGGGSVGLCTATLINPRTVIFAAHCVNTAAATSYGANSGGTAIGFGFETNTRANAAGQTDELVRWLLGGTGGAGKFQTNIAQAFYNASFVAYNPLSLEPAANGFLYGDVAMATLDTPAANIPTWALLFSQLPAPASINAAGTGYNVGLVGYGNNGTGQAGSTTIDFRRRAADNVLGALTDLVTFETFLFGAPSNASLTQNLYFLDFDDPRRGLGSASPFDFNAFRDNARTSGGTPTEGITASGDSGGPLILQGFSKQVVIGVLSGGYTRFFSGQPANSYGTVSFYQPLYLYWDWIAANNPYHYVSSVAGNGNWTDPTHWVTTLDPAYNILSGTTIVNGIPTVAGEQKNGTTGDFGQICFQSGGVSDCLDTKTGTETVEAKPIGTATDEPAVANVATDSVATRNSLGDLVYNIEKQDGSESTNGVSTLALPAATLANGLPGATNFVPNNSDPVRTTGTAGRYFDVTLASTGTTTLGSAVTIDRLTLGTGGATLQIDAAGSLTSLINVLEFAGTMNVNGTLNSVGEYSLFGGVVTGSGRINAPFLTSVLGQFSPGTATTTGTLTIGGNLVLGTGSQYFVNLGPSGASDKIAVVANGSSTGLANVGGSVLFSPVSGYTIRGGDIYTILTSQDARTGTFSTAALSAILTPTFLYSANDVKVQIVAGTYASVVNTGSPVQVAYANLLDGDRAGSGSALAALYGPLDLQNQATIRATLDSWAPRGETLKTALGEVLTDNMARFYRDRLDSLGTGNTGGTVAIIGSPLSVLSSATTIGPMGSMAATAMDSGTPQTSVTEGQVPDDISVFFAGGYLNGSAAPMPTAIPLGGRSKFDGWYGAAGIEKNVSSIVTIGFGLSYSNSSGTTTAADQVKGELYQGTLYAKAAWPNGFAIDAVASAGQFDARTTRVASLAGTDYTLKSDDRSLALSGELGLAKTWDLGSVKIGPRAAVRYGEIGFSDTVESGGPMALRISRNRFDSLQGRIGLTLGGATGKVRPYLTGYYVHDFNDTPASFGANFVGGTGPAAAFALAGVDKDWWEISGGLGLDLRNVTLSVGADTTISRTDVKNQSYRASIKFRF